MVDDEKYYTFFSVMMLTCIFCFSLQVCFSDLLVRRLGPSNAVSNLRRRGRKEKRKKEKERRTRTECLEPVRSRSERGGSGEVSTVNREKRDNEGEEAAGRVASEDAKIGGGGIVEDFP